MIQIDPAALQTMQGRINAWASNLKQTVTTQANQELGHVENVQTFVGQAATAYKAKFAEMVTQINKAIGDIADGQIAGMGQQLLSISNTFTEADSSIAKGMSGGSA